MSSAPSSSRMVAGGLPVLGGRNSCPQVAGPFFSGLAAGRDWRGLAGGGGDGEERVREHRQRDVPVPGAVAADLVVIKAGLVLGGLDAGLNRPPLMPMKRRPIETGNKQLKTYLRGPGKVLRSQSPDMVRQEIYGYLLTRPFPPEQRDRALARVMADITRKKNLNTRRRHRTYPRVVKRARHNSYRVKKPGDTGTRHDGPATIKLANARPLTLAA